MALPTGRLIKAVLGGPIAAQDDWSIGFWATAAADTGDFNAAAQSIFESFNTKFWSASSSPWKSFVAAATKLSTCTLYGYSGGVLDGQGQYAIGAPVAGSGTAIHPAYVAQVFTLRTAQFGRSFRGRVYLPATGMDVASTSLQSMVSQTQCTNLALFLRDALEGGWGDTYVPSVVSQTKGVSTSIQAVVVDTIFDTQHGRVGQETAAGTFSAAVPAA